MVTDNRNVVCEPLSPRWLVPLVLHRIVRGMPSDWEDVQEERLQEIVNYIGPRWGVFREGGMKDDARWMLTFDDGYVSDYEIVFPLLRENALSATFFLITDRIGSPGYLSTTQIVEMSRLGMCFGSHSRTHRRMTSLSTEDAQREFSESKRRLEDILDVPVEAFSYPFGDCSPKFHQLGFAAGYVYLCTSAHGVLGASDYVVPRNSIHSAMGWESITEIMQPTAGARLRWVLEDHVKSAVKAAVGHERYIRWRNRTLGAK